MASSTGMRFNGVLFDESFDESFDGLFKLSLKVNFIVMALYLGFF